MLRLPDDKLTQSEVSPEWIQRAMQARDARAAKLAILLYGNLRKHA
jgi:hypothetical protein